MAALAPYACDPEQSGGRLVLEPEGPLRTPYQRDRDRIIHATAFRRLEYKTQVLVNFEGDHFRTRLTHSLEVAQIARTLSRALALNEDLAEAIALAHDLGHCAFGHAGEAALDDGLRAFGGFDHNLQTFRVVTRLERRYARFDGLNLTVETLEGVLKHNGPMMEPHETVARHPLCRQLRLDRQAPLEGQVAAIADDVAYCNHDLDDGLRADFFTRRDLLDLPIIGPMVEAVAREHPDLREERLIHETIRRLIDHMVNDLVTETRHRIAALAPKDVQAVREARGPCVGFSPATAEAVMALRDFLHRHMYRHYKVNRMSLKARRLVGDLVETFLAVPDTLPEPWRERVDASNASAVAEVVRDYIAGMTDRFALDEHDRLFRLTRRSL